VYTITVTNKGPDPATNDGRATSGLHRVALRGAGIRVVGVTHRKGRSLTVTLPSRNTCRGARRIGVVAVFQPPPVTG